MPVLQWDAAGDRIYESGLDHGVLYLEDGSAVPWNGLTAVTESFDKTTSPIYFDGSKVNDLVTLGDFQASLKAITYPDEFLRFEGIGNALEGVQFSDQKPKTFALSYRTQIGSDVEASGEGYKIHVLYNVTAIPSNKDYASFSSDPTLTEFEWTITAVPEEVPGFRPTAHIIFDSRYIDPDLLADIELLLYGGVTANAALPAFADLIELLFGFYRVEIVDNKDGTWTANTIFEGYISMLSEEEFQIDNVDATYLDADTYEISSTR